jgi:hypothetical protein
VKYLKKEEMGTSIYILERNNHNLVQQFLHKVKEYLQMQLGYLFEGLSWEEELLYAVASNCNLFDTGMFRYTEKQIFKKCLKVVPVPLRGYLDTRIMEDIQFYARFLAVYISKLKKVQVKRDKSFDSSSLIGNREAWVENKAEKLVKW